jgi:hypothetical protein
LRKALKQFAMRVELRRLKLTNASDEFFHDR